MIEKGGIDTTKDPSTELEDDIRTLASDYNYEWGREKLIDDLVEVYPDLTKDQIAEMVYNITNELWGK